MKVSCVSLTCSSCNSSYEVYLRQQPHSLVITCPKCDSSISYGESIASKKEAQITCDSIIEFSTELEKCKTFDDVMRLICPKK